MDSIEGTKVLGKTNQSYFHSKLPKVERGRVQRWAIKWRVVVSYKQRGDEGKWDVVL